MSSIINPFKRVKNIINPFDAIRENRELAYAAKHQRDGVMFTGNVRCEHFRAGIPIGPQGWEPTPNTFTTEGMARMLNIIFHDIAKAAAEIWYVGIFKNNVTPAVGDTAAAKLGAAGSYGECQDADYDSPATNKPGYTTADTATATITNAVAGKAEFTMAASITVYGAFLSSEAAKTATSGYLMCAKKFATARQVIDDDVLYVTYAITASTS